MWHQNDTNGPGGLVRSFFWLPGKGDPLLGGASFGASGQFGGWLIRLRWLAIGVIAFLGVLNDLFLHYVDVEPMRGVWGTTVALAVLNVTYILSRRHSSLLDQYGLFVQVSVDMIALTVLLHFSGGIENPLAFAYVFHVILSAIFFQRVLALGAVAFSTLMVGLLAFGEYGELLPHYTVEVFPHFGDEIGERHASHDFRYVTVRVGLHLMFMGLSSSFVSALMDRLHRAADDIRGERRKLHHVIQSTGVGLAIVHRSAPPEVVNPDDPIWSPLGGYASEAVWRQWLNELSSGLDRFSRFNQSEHERELVVQGGEIRHYQVKLSNLSADASAGEMLLTAMISDVTERRRMESEMWHADRISMLGKVSAGIAHEVGNPLASISTRLSLLEDSDSIEELKSGLSPLKEQVARINRIVRGVSQIARPQHGKWSRFDLREAIEETLEVVRLHKGAVHCTIECAMPADRILVDGVKDQLEQVFLNLCLNALDAMPKGGVFKIEYEIEGSSHLVRFSDNGVGMSDEDAKRVFDLFFTTKRSGLGIGMHIAFQIITAHRGEISVSSKLGVGTAFLVSLPVADSL